MSDYINKLETQLATSCDLINRWCREAGVQECLNPFDNLGLRQAVDRLWAKESSVFGDRLESYTRQIEIVDQLLDWMATTCPERPGLRNS